MSSFAALAETHRCHWQIWGRPSVLPWSPFALKPTSAACAGASPVKPEPRPADSFPLVTPVTSLPDPGRQVGTKERKEKVWCPAKQLPSFLLSVPKKGKGHHLFSFLSHHLISQASAFQVNYMSITLTTGKNLKDLWTGEFYSHPNSQKN